MIVQDIRADCSGNLGWFAPSPERVLLASYIYIGRACIYIYFVGMYSELVDGVHKLPTAQVEWLVDNPDTWTGRLTRHYAPGTTEPTRLFATVSRERLQQNWQLLSRHAPDFLIICSTIEVGKVPNTNVCLALTYEFLGHCDQRVHFIPEEWTHCLLDTSPSPRDS